MNKHFKNIITKYPFVITYSLTFSELLFGYILLLFITREYAAEDVGLWFLFFSIFNFSINIREGVVYVALVKFSSGKEKIDANQTYKTVLIAIVLIELLIGIVICSIGLLDLFKNLSSLLISYPLFSLSINLLKWVENIHKSKKTIYIAVIINSITLTFLCISLYYVHSNHLSINQLVYCLIVVYLCSFCISLFTIPFKKIIKSKVNKQTFSSIMLYAKQGFLKALFGTISSKMTLFLSAGILSLEITALLGLAQRYLVIILSISNSIQLIFYPRIVKLFEKGSLDKLKEVFIDTLSQVYLIILPISIGFIIFIKPIITFLHGNAYSDSFYLLIILVISSLFAPLGSFFASYTNAKGKPQYSTNIVVFNSILLIITSVIFVELYGEIGTVLPGLITEIVGSILIFIYFLKKENLNLFVSVHSMKRQMKETISLLLKRKKI
ncbi:MATE family efflux transporter [Flammeovirga kamogawensis]|uniref:Oligosaccharide flippase family protein n=1 Tax=Flammeovirga kamogawensis TaxID=373891 RepID=A0ABX8H283_9BACT|nr:polysaccharide biosynthesis C-terminal domain-containing protein [Flammeovirga kamogawensis]MBB6460206.1 O-antigen/teichoic acid export membrane protein [Flammeovirga kamogawensis]QWG10018.1 hypothetical protein KM029_20260 [Flammeovirga kamogawensis]TRX65526.1 hypothetical protein EO216_23690 [Flammeovirga kamogawensis]